MATTSLQLPAPIQARPPSARLVYIALRDNAGPLTTDRLVEETGVSVDRIRRLLGELAEAGLVAAEPSPDDGRRKCWTVTEATR
ncbi:MarR family transcriptional regulator [Haloarcula onubensis]|uniref:MarR family transcriptional regulator n=1 Tax=Haloarcula onubensis TaxID=2950539 RepID=A0ABU2FVC8_9EURY|nr:MarR family transcriptional regulator [Halomicroarcula sp. S3CR25-11]MDS0284740.1 MarR family transcriptional regulator [Halomicroarcula sp. S3CR25-11]